MAVVDGLLTRTYFRNSADAVKRAGVATSHIYELGERLPSRRRSWPGAGGRSTATSTTCSLGYDAAWLKSHW